VTHLTDPRQIDAWRAKSHEVRSLRGAVHE